jgi:UDP-GlcNAc3NAcA epimerase
MQVLSIVGNRPQFIKSAPLSAALSQAGIDEVVLHTGQHYDPELSEVFYEELGLAPPRYRLDTRSADPAQMVPRIREVVESEKPDWVLVFGDTNSTLAGAQAAGGRPIAHVEAGLRSFDASMPEERNRIAVDAVSSLLLCPDERSSAQLEREGIAAPREVVGDVMADAARLFAPIAHARSRILERLGLEPHAFVLVTLHREANTRPERLAQIMTGLKQLPDRVVFPAHPRTRAALDQLGDGAVELLAPLGYLDFTELVAHARAIVTDSGGVQKEAYWHRVPCVTTRPSTEWVDTVIAGANVLVDDDPLALIAAVATASFPPESPVLYGDGHAAERIATALYANRP